MILKNIKKMLFFVPVLTLGHAICGSVLQKTVLALSQALKTSKIHRFYRFKDHKSVFPKQMSNINFARCYPMLENAQVSAILAILLETSIFLWFPFLCYESPAEFCQQNCNTQVKKNCHMKNRMGASCVRHVLFMCPSCARSCVWTRLTFSHHLYDSTSRLPTARRHMKKALYYDSIFSQ